MTSSMTISAIIIQYYLVINFAYEKKQDLFV